MLYIHICIYIYVASIKIVLTIHHSPQLAYKNKNTKSETKIERKEQKLTHRAALNVPKKARHYKG